MPPPDHDQELEYVQHLHRQIVRSGVNAPGLLRLCQRYEEIYTTIDRFAREGRDNISFWDDAARERHDSYIRILTHSLKAVVGQLELLRQAYDDEFRAAMDRRRRA